MFQFIAKSPHAYFIPLTHYSRIFLWHHGFFLLFWLSPYYTIISSIFKRRKLNNKKQICPFHLSPQPPTTLPLSFLLIKFLETSGYVHCFQFLFFPSSLRHLNQAFTSTNTYWIRDIQREELYMIFLLVEAISDLHFAKTVVSFQSPSCLICQQYLYSWSLLSLVKCFLLLDTTHSGNF